MLLLSRTEYSKVALECLQSGKSRNFVAYMSNLTTKFRSVLYQNFHSLAPTLESGIDVGQGITVGPGKFVKKNKHRALNKGRA